MGGATICKCIYIYIDLFIHLFILLIYLHICYIFVCLRRAVGIQGSLGACLFQLQPSSVCLFGVPPLPAVGVVLFEEFRGIEVSFSKKPSEEVPLRSIAGVVDVSYIYIHIYIYMLPPPLT